MQQIRDNACIRFDCVALAIIGTFHLFNFSRYHFRFATQPRATDADASKLQPGKVLTVTKD
ncbi:hypothetical protein DOZ58_04170 [Acetobacterium sp. KB-1]|nr:hypothetical protein DOZ58_04170 [Acetobacterium sp. KB-1]